MLAKDSGASRFHYADGDCELELEFPVGPVASPAVVAFVPPVDRGQVVGAPGGRPSMYARAMGGQPLPRLADDK